VRSPPELIPSHELTRSLRWVLAGGGLFGVVAAVTAAPDSAQAAAAQVWPPFVLVAGLLLVGFVAQEDGLFAAGGHTLARISPNGVVLYVGAAVLVVGVTTLLNLDTSVTFLTPVLVAAARSRGEDEASLMYACLLLSNAGSLFLPGANLTNLIVLGHLHLSGGAFFARMALPAIVAAVVTASIVAAVYHRQLRTTATPTGEPERPVLGVGLVAVGAVAVLVLALHSPALPVAAVGVVALLLRSRGNDRSASIGTAVRVLDVRVLAGLFGVAVTLGTLGRAWSGPETLLSHVDAWGTAAVAALSSVLLNNLPAASLLAAHRPAHPYALLVGLNVGSNLFATGSLAWLLWLRAARAAGGRPDVKRAVSLGLVSAPIAIVGAVAVLYAPGPH
jgi:arsenical pump membrane protein